MERFSVVAGNPAKKYQMSETYVYNQHNEVVVSGSARVILPIEKKCELL